MTLNPTTLNVLRAEMTAALAEVAKKHGVVLSLGSASYMAESATFKLNVATVNDSGEVITKEATMFRLCAPQYGLTPELLHTTFTQGGKTFKLTGLGNRQAKMPFQAIEVATGRNYKFPIESILKGYGLPPRKSLFA